MMKTKYGNLNGIEDAEYYPSGQLRSCKVTKPTVLSTTLGLLYPQYETIDERRKLTGSIEFYEDGSLMSVNLATQMFISTSAGLLPAEKILFYNNGNIKRIFPLNGKLSGYWCEENEYTLSKCINLSVGSYSISAKFISISFYDSGNIKSLTLWPKERVSLATPFGTISVRKGISFYEDSSVKSFEPALPVSITTPVGIVSCYNNDVVGLNGDINSITLTERGGIKSLVTCSTGFHFSSSDFSKDIIPNLKAGWCNELIKYPVAIKAEFSETSIIINDTFIFDISKCRTFVPDMKKCKIEEDMAC